MPPTRANVIPANELIHVTLPRPIEASSVLFNPKVFGAPALALTVIEMSSCARELLQTCSVFTNRNSLVDPYGRQQFFTTGEFHS